MSCLVPGCRSNYKGEDKTTTVFNFPKNPEKREEWFKAIPRPRGDYENNKYLKVCMNHFKEEDIEKNYEYFDGINTVVMPRNFLKLKKTAVPSIFPNCPSYLTDVTRKPKRFSKDDKEKAMFQSACAQSLMDSQVTDIKFAVSSYTDFINKLHVIVLPKSWVLYEFDKQSVFFLKIFVINGIPTIERSLEVDQTLFVKAFYKQQCQINISILSINDTRQIESLLFEINSFEDVNFEVTPSKQSIQSHVKTAVFELENAINLIENDECEADTDDTESCDTIFLHFFVDQLKYFIIPKNGRRYDILTQTIALKIYGLSPACYRLIQSSNCLIFPHERSILKIKNTIGLDLEYIRILRDIATTFKKNERHVVLQMDEVHIRSDAYYKGGKIIGSIDNQNDPPTTVFAMMISSLMKKYSTIVRLIPLGSSSAEQLFPIVKQAIIDIETCNLFVEAICTDNYPLNVSLFKLFSNDSKTLQPKVRHPCNSERNLVLFFDIVHIIKSIRNNWINLKDNEKTFIFPKFEECEPICINYSFTNQLRISVPTNLISLSHISKSNYPKICYAPFEDIRTLYRSDKYSVLKRAPKLTLKSCWPSILERQNVNYALKVFDDSTIAGLLSFKMENNTSNLTHTAQFMELICNIWKIFNVNWVGKNIRFNDQFFSPLRLNDERLSFLAKIVCWLDCWKELPYIQGKLTTQTFQSLKHTCVALPLLIERLVKECGFEYLLSSRIQNDPLEHHFGIYRQMSGAHYHISYGQILESERRLQLSNILNFFPKFCPKDPTDKHISLKEYLNTFSDTNNEHEGTDIDIDFFMNELKLIITPDLNKSQIESLTYVAGYAVYSYLKKSKECLHCQTFLTIQNSIEINNDINSQYKLIDLLDRGALKYPSNNVIQCVHTMYEIFLKIDNSERLKHDFYKGSCRKRLVDISTLVVQKRYPEIWRIWCFCSISRWDILSSLFITVSNCILSKRVRNYNDLVLGRNNSKLQKFS